MKLTEKTTEAIRAAAPGAAAAAGAFAALAGAGGAAIARYTMNGHRQSLEEALRWQREHYDISWYPGLKKKNYLFTCSDGYELHVQLCEDPKTAVSGKYVILTHGHTDNRFGTLKYMRIYLDLGFRCIIYDLRGHGANQRTWCSFGIREGRDLYELICDTLERYGTDIVLGLHGESLGSSTSIMALGYAPGVDFVVADCGFAEIAPIIRGGLKMAHLPGSLARLGSAGAKVLYGYSYEEMRPIDALPENRTPILFIHGAEDGFIPPSHSERMHEATGGYSELVLIPGARHAASVLTEPQLYADSVREFLERCGLAGGDEGPETD